MAGIAIGFPAKLEGGSVRYLRAIVLAKCPLSVGLKGSANLVQLDSPTPQQCRGQPHPLSRRNRPAIVHCIQRLSRHSLPQSQPAHSTPQPGSTTPLPSSPKKHAKGRQYPQDRRGKRPGMRKPNSRDKSQQSTELIGAPIGRDPIPNDGVYVLHLHDTR